MSKRAASPRRRRSACRAARARAAAAPCGSRKATTRSLGHHHGRVGALQARHHVGDGVLDRLAVVGGEQRRDDLRVGGERKVDAALLQLGPELDRVDQVAVVGERELAPVVAPDRLRVLPGAAAGRRVADVADRHVALQRAQLLLVEDLVDEALVAHRHDVAALAGGDPGRLLAAVLERVEARSTTRRATSCPGAYMPKTPHSSRGDRDLSAAPGAESSACFPRGLET